MTLRSLFLTALSASALSMASLAQAHDPKLHDDYVPPPKAKPTTCAQLADTTRYSNDVTDPDIKALKTRCDAEKKAAAKPSTNKTT